MHHPRSANGTTVVVPVAIKTLKENAPTQARQEFCRELEKVAVLQHPNVVCLVAVCVREGPLCMLFEYMFQCDLHEFLLVHSPHSDVSARSDDGTPQILELSDFLAIAIQIASGKYVQSHHTMNGKSRRTHLLNFLLCHGSIWKKIFAASSDGSFLGAIEDWRFKCGAGAIGNTKKS